MSVTRHYARSGVDTDQVDRALTRLLLEIAPTQAFGAKSELGVGHFAAVVRVGPVCLALTADGVGTKVMIAALAGRYDTVGIDCVAMNVNDLICVGARPVAMLDYIAVERPDPEVFAQIGRGLLEGAKQADVSIVGGETAQIPDMLRGVREGLGLDLAGMAVGIVPEGELVDGSAIRPGDVVIGIGSNGLHSNGHSLARRVLLPRFELDGYLDELGSTLAEELLRPTQIYVPQVNALREAGVRPRALAHITGDGLLNLRRVEAAVGFEITDPPDPPAIFTLIERYGEVDRAEMRAVFNMGVGFAVTVAEGEADRALKALHSTGAAAWPIGRTFADPERRVRLPHERLVGRSKHFEPEPS
jgi:phosphoribosylformylglycinamidine cyclo-ligase